MNKKLKVYIDHCNSEQDFARKLVKRLSALEFDNLITTYDDEDDGKTENWEITTLNALKNADIIIPIVSQEYLTFVSDGIRNILNDASKSDSRYLFPVIYENAEWGNNPWIVRSKTFPSDSSAINDLSTNQENKVINELVSTINQIGNRSSILDEIEKLEKASDSGNLVFISHDHDDADFAELLKLKLEKEGINAWIDSERLKIGQDWRVEIDDSIAKSLAMIVVMSPEARKSEYVTYEWAYAWGKNIKIFPIMLKQTQLHPRLESLQYLDFTKRESRPYYELIKSILGLK